MDTSREISPSTPVIESASASTACQTNSSKFAYIVTGIVLGIVLLLGTGIAALVVLGVDASYTYNDRDSLALDGTGGYDGFDDYGYGHGYDDWDNFGHDWEDDWYGYEYGNGASTLLP